MTTGPMESAITIVQSGRMFRVSYMGQTADCNWEEMIGLVASISMPLSLTISPDSRVTVRRPCMTFLRADVPAPSVTPMHPVEEALSAAMELENLTACDVVEGRYDFAELPEESNLVKNLQPGESAYVHGQTLTKLATGELRKQACLLRKINGTADSKPHRPTAPLKPASPMRIEPITSQHIRDDKSLHWGKCEELVYQWVKQHGSSTPGDIAEALTKETGESVLAAHVGYAVRASTRMAKDGSYVCLLASEADAGE